jgi:hypothetical protein
VKNKSTGELFPLKESMLRRWSLGMASPALWRFQIIQSINGRYSSEHFWYAESAQIYISMVYL